MIERGGPADGRTGSQNAVRGEREVDKAALEEIGKAVDFPNGAGCGRRDEREQAEGGE